MSTIQTSVPTHHHAEADTDRLTIYIPRALVGRLRRLREDGANLNISLICRNALRLAVDQVESNMEENS